MKKLGLIIAVMLVTLTANAQFNFGVKGGYNLNTISLKGDLADNLNSENKGGFYIGPTVKFTLPIIGVGVDAAALYTQSTTSIEAVDVKRQSVAVPVNLRFGVGLGDLANIFIFAGPQFDFAIGDKKFDIKNAQQELGEYTLRSSNLSVNIGAGLFIFNHVQLNVNYNIACGTTADFDYKSAASYKELDSKEKTWQVGVAYYF